MCGRYYVDDETAKAIERLVKEISGRNEINRLREMKNGDIHPSDEAPVLIAKGNHVEAAWQRWGFPGFQGKGLVFNARSETVLEKNMFRNSILHRRSVVPCTWFYEWNKNKEKVTFQRKEEPVMFLAGFYNYYGEDQRFVILTTEADEVMAPVHDRMPLILNADQIEKWILDDKEFQPMMRERSSLPVPLKVRQDYEQLKLF
mgnify:FL=1